MELSASRCSGFRIDSLLSLSPPGALLSRPDPRELSPGSSCSALASPRREPLLRLEAPLLPGRLQARSSFLIRDILADCAPRSRPVQDCSEPGHPEGEAEPLRSGREEAYPDRSQSSCSVSESREPRSSDPAAARPRKPRKARTAFSEQQLSQLERSFHRRKYLSVQDRVQLAAALQLSDTQVKTWYQNRRTKWKRQSAVGLELLAEASRIILPSHFLFPAAPPTLDLYMYRTQAPPLLPHIPPTLTH